MSKIDLKSLSENELISLISDLNLPSFRSKQLIHWIYQRYAQSIDEITEFSFKLRKELSEEFFISNLNLIDRRISIDGTEKFLFTLLDGESIESVLIPDEDRLTLCISSQVGCSLGCIFCATGRLGFRRNLKAYEIVDQIICVSRLILPKHLTNIVLMGMGEPLLNFSNTVEALWRISRLLNISPRRITLSTSGIATKIVELGEKAPPINLAISLNAAEDHIRNYIMPINKTYPLKILIDVCRKFPLRSRQRITFEYIMLKGINDSVFDAKRLAGLLKGIPSKINLISFNPFKGTTLQGSDYENIIRFQKILLDNNLPAFIRKSKGQDISAACGQLRANYVISHDDI